LTHQVLRITNKLYNTPHLIEQKQFDNIVTYLNDRNNSPDFKIDIDSKKQTSFYEYNPDTKIGMIEVNGALTYKSTGWEAMCGGFSYEQLQESVQSLITEGAKTILMVMDSPGGEAYGMMETGKTIRKLADDNNVKIVSYVDGLAASAGYGLAVASHEIISNPMSEVGSIGVVVKLRNTNKAMKKLGVEDSYVFAGKSKIPFDSEGEFTQEFINDIQMKVDTLYNEFTSYVSEMRGISLEGVRNTEAKTFLSNAALELGLVDKVMTREEFSNYLADIVQKENSMKFFKLNSDTTKVSMKEEYSDMSQITELQAELDGVRTLLSESETKLQEAFSVAEAKSAEAVELALTLEKVKEELSALQAEKAQAIVAARKEKLSALLPVDQVEAMYESTKVLDQTAFSTIVSTLEAKTKAEKESTMFKEVGAEGEADASADSSVAKILEAKYKKQ
jgi:signal peptide peptidase SppA